MDARTLAVAALLLPALLAGCAQDDGNGGSGADLHAACRDALQDQGEVADRPVRNGSNPTVLLSTNCGEIRLELYVDVTPITAGNFLNLTEDGFYDGTRFHRVVSGFVIQDGDPKTKDPDKRDEWGTGGPGYTIRDEFPCQDGNTSYEHPGSYDDPPDQCDDHGGFLLTHDGPGVLSMANQGRPETGSSQYFITLAETSNLDGYHPVFGQVIGGLDVVQAIGQVPTEARDRPQTDLVISDVAIVDG